MAFSLMWMVGGGRDLVVSRPSPCILTRDLAWCYRSSLRQSPAENISCFPRETRLVAARRRSCLFSSLVFGAIAVVTIHRSKEPSGYLLSPLPSSIAPGSWMFLVVSRAVVLSLVLEALDLSANVC